MPFGLLSFLLPLALYVGIPSCMWNFDGVACAAALELGNPVFLFHGNHLLYGFLGYAFWKFLLFPLGVLRALPALQLFTSLLSAAGLIGLYHIVRNQIHDRAFSGMTTLCMSVTAVFWVWSLEAQVYALGVLGLSAATFLLLGPSRPWKWRGVGLFHALAVLGHVVHGLWTLPALLYLWKNESSSIELRKKCMRSYLTSLLLGTTLPYLIVVGAVILPRHPQVRWISQWLLGSAALTPTREFAWHGGGAMGPGVWAWTTLRFFWGAFWPYQNTPVPAWGWILTGLSMTGFAVLLIRSWRERRKPAWAFSGMWLAVYGVFWWTWEPGTECYRMPEVVPIAILISLGLGTWKDGIWKWSFVAILLISTLVANLATRIEPMSQPAQNRLFDEVLRLAALTPQNSIYVTTGGTPWIYLLYFTGRTAWNLPANTQAKIVVDRVLQRENPRPVFISSSALDAHALKSRAHQFDLQPIGQDLPWWRLHPKFQTLGGPRPPLTGPAQVDRRLFLGGP